MPRHISSFLTNHPSDNKASSNQNNLGNSDLNAKVDSNSKAPIVTETKETVLLSKSQQIVLDNQVNQDSCRENITNGHVDNAISNLAKESKTASKTKIVDIEGDVLTTTKETSEEQQSKKRRVEKSNDSVEEKSKAQQLPLANEVERATNATGAKLEQHGNAENAEVMDLVPAGGFDVNDEIDEDAVDSIEGVIYSAVEEVQGENQSNDESNVYASEYEKEARSSVQAFQQSKMNILPTNCKLTTDMQDQSNLSESTGEGIQNLKEQHLQQQTNNELQLKQKSAGSTNKEKWEENFEKLKKFQLEHGHCRITQAQTDRSFYSWINRQRHLYKALKSGKKVSLNQDKVDRLNALGFVWNVYDSKCLKVDASSHGDPPRVKTWDEHLEDLKAYKLLHGDTQVPQRSGAYPDLADWVERQQAAHKQVSLGKESHLTLEKVVKLNCLGFVWEREKVKGVWEKRLEELRKYRSRFGTCNVPEKYEENIQLGKWVATQRQQYYRLQNGKKSHMSEARIKELENLDFEWEIKKTDTWNDRLNELIAYKDQHGDCNVPLKYVHSPKLSFWVRTQREQYRQLREKKRPSNMTEDRIKKLEDIGFSWALKKQRGPNTKWEDRIKELQQYIIEHGHGNVSHVINPKLANWVTSQRKQRNLFKSGKTSSISVERIEALNRIGFEWVVREPQRREDRMNELRAYKEEFGNCMVPKRWARNRRLGQWVAEQRKQYRYLMAGKPSHMTPERVVELETVGFIWSLQGKPANYNHSAKAKTPPSTNTTLAKV